MKKLIALIGIFWLLILSPSCNKNDDNIRYYNFQTVTEDFMVAYLIYSEAYFRIDAILKTFEDSLSVHPSGTYPWGKATVTFTPADSNTYPKSFTLDYGTRALDSLTGKISGNITKKYLEPGSVVSYTYLNYTVDSNTVMGFDTIWTQGETSGIISFIFAVNDGIIVKNLSDDGKDTITFESIEHPQLYVQSGQIIMSEAYAAGLSSDSMRFAVDVNSGYPLIKNPDCEFIGDGIFNYHIKDFLYTSIGEGSMDFGWPNPGDCDKYLGIGISATGYDVQIQFIMD
jgi:hypothetical protein